MNGNNVLHDKKETLRDGKILSTKDIASLKTRIDELVHYIQIIPNKFLLDSNINN
jgi:hypothetical protein